MDQALKSAAQYLDHQAFSQSGLAKQLEYEKFTPDQAQYGAENCGADWNEQAVKCAESYIDMGGFSQDSLKQQLEYEGFTSEQAQHGASEVFK